MSGRHTAEIDVGRLPRLLGRAPYALRPQAPFFRRTRETLPHAGVPQKARDGVRTHQRHPAPRFGPFVGAAPFAPVRMRGAQHDHLLLHRWGRARGMARGAAGLLLQRLIASCLEATLPLVEGAPPHRGGRTCRLPIARLLPCFKQQAARRGAGVVLRNESAPRGPSLPSFPRRSRHAGIQRLCRFPPLLSVPQRPLFVQHGLAQNSFLKKRPR